MKRYLLLAIFTFNVLCASAQFVNGDYRSRSGGDWGSPLRWQVFFSGAWRNVNTASAGPFFNVVPSSASGEIIILHSIRVNASTTANEVTIVNGARLTINGSKVLTIVDDFSQTPLQINAGGILTNNGTLDLQTQLSATPCVVDGTLENTVSILTFDASLLVFNAGSNYRHLNRTGGDIPLGTWNIASTCTIAGMAEANALPPNNLGQAFGNFTWNTPSMGSSTTFSLGGGLQTVNGDFTVVSTGSTPKVVRLKSGGPGYNLAVGGNFVIQSGSLALTQSQTSTTSITVGGDINITGGTLTLGITNNSPTNVFLNGNFQKSAGTITRGTGTGAGTIRFDGAVQTYANNADINSAINFAVESGSNLNLGTTYLSGTGTFALNTGGTLQVGSVDALGAIQTTTTGGNIRVSGIRTYQTGTTVIYNGAAQQFMASGHPAASNTIINNANNIRVLANVAINGDLTVSSGNLLLESATLTLGGLYNQVGGFIGITPNSSIVVNGTGPFGNLVLLPYSFPANPMNNLTINRGGGGQVTQGTAQLTVAGTLTLSAGDFHLGSNSTTIQGPFVQAGGTMSSTIFSTLAITTTIAPPGDVIPADITINGGAINTLTMNRAGRTFFTSSTLAVTNLNLTAGNVSHGGAMSMANGGLITRRFGNLLTAVGAAGTYSVLYSDVNGPVLSGLEIPSTAGVLNNFTVNNTYNVTNAFGAPPYFLTLGSAVDAAGNFTVTEGNVITNNFAINVGGNFTIAANGTIQPGTSVLTLDGGAPQNITSSGALVLDQVVINQAPASSVALLSPLDIITSLTITSGSDLDIGSNQLRLLSNGTTTAFIPQLNPATAITGTATMQRHLPNTAGILAYRYIAPMATGSFVSDWQAEFAITGTFSNPSTGPGIISGNPSLYYYDETFNTTAPTWEARYRNYPSSGLSSAAPLVNGLGYAAWIRTTAPTMYDTRGGIRQHNVDIVVSNSGGTALDGYNLLGNPYPAPISWDNVLASSTGVDAAIYFTDNTRNADGVTTRIVYSGGVSTPPGVYDGTIAQGQGFWVHAGAGGGTVSFRETHKVAGQAEFLRESEIPNLLYVKMKTGNKADYIAIRLHEEATDEFDSRWDAYQFGASGLYLSSLSKNNEKLVINTISSLGCDYTVPLQVDGALAGSYTFDFTGLETFNGDITLYLNDKVLDKKILLSESPQYAFTVSDVASLKNRFEIFVGRPPVETGLTVTSESVCENNATAAYITLQNTQHNVAYSVEWNGETLTADAAGNGGLLSIQVPVENIPQGDHEFTIMAQMKSCAAVQLTNKANVTIAEKSVVERVEDGSVCKEGAVVVTAVGQGASRFNWYEDLDDENPIEGQNGESFTTPVLAKSKTYYVAAVNALGCESERVAVNANVTLLEDVTIAAQGNILISSYETGNQWYFDGTALENETGKQVEATMTGTYSVVTTVDGCSTTAAREMVVTGIAETRADFITIYPNPTTDKIAVEVKSDNISLQAKLLNPMGIELNMVTLKGESEIKSGEFDLLSYPAGMYMVRIHDGRKVYTVKISKVK